MSFSFLKDNMQIKELLTVLDAIKRLWSSAKNSASATVYVSRSHYSLSNDVLGAPLVVWFSFVWYYIPRLQWLRNVPFFLTVRRNSGSRLKILFNHLSVVFPQSLQTGVCKWRLPHIELEEPMSLTRTPLKLVPTLVGHSWCESWGPRRAPNGQMGSIFFFLKQSLAAISVQVPLKQIALKEKPASLLNCRPAFKKGWFLESYFNQ